MRNFLIFLLLSILAGFSSPGWAAPSAKDFGENKLIYDAAISPDATKIAVFVNFGGTYGIRILNLTGENSAEDAKAVLLGKNAKPVWIKWANNDYVLASIWSSQKLYGTPVTTGGLYSLNTVKMKGKYLAEVPEGIIRQFSNKVVDFLDDDPDHILMAFSDEDAWMPDIYKVNVKTRRKKRVRRGRANIQDWYADRRGEPRIGRGAEERGSSEPKYKMLIRDRDEDKWRSSKEYPGLDPEESIFGFTSNPDELIIGRRAGKDTKGLYVYDLGQKKFTQTLFHNDEYDVSGIVLSPDGSEVIGARYYSSREHIELFNQHNSALHKIRDKYDTYNVDFVDVSRDGQNYLVNMSSAQDPGALMMVSETTGELSYLAAFRPKLKTTEMGEVIAVRYTARDGEKIPAYVTLPPSVSDTSQIKNLPFIILPHGGPYAREVNRFDYFAQFFATRGYAVLQMNFRGSAGYGKKFKDAGRKNWVVMQEDVEDGMHWLLRKGYADPDKTCIAGWSYGGYAALMGAATNPELYACTVSIAGVTDLKDLIRDAKKYQFGRFGAKYSIIAGFTDKDAIKENSPVRRADEIKVPVYLAHGTLDQRVHFDQYKRMKRALEKADADVTALSFKDEDHFLSDQTNRQAMFVALEKFLEKSNGKSDYMK